MLLLLVVVSVTPFHVWMSCCRAFNPSLKRFNVSTKAVTDGLLQLWAKCKAQVEAILKEHGVLAASVTTDSWTSKGNQHFTATTIHFIAEYMVREGLLVKSDSARAGPSSAPEAEVFDPTKATIQVVCLPLDCVSTPGPFVQSSQVLQLFTTTASAAVTS